MTSTPASKLTADEFFTKFPLTVESDALVDKTDTLTMFVRRYDLAHSILEGADRTKVLQSLINRFDQFRETLTEWEVVNMDYHLQIFAYYRAAYPPENTETLCTDGDSNV